MRAYKVEIEIYLNDEAKTDWIADAISENLESGEHFFIDINEVKEGENE